jgi:reactive intermediate/imine deaminase
VPICRLRPYTPGDAEPLRDAVRESVEAAFPWLPWCHAEYSLADAAEWIRSRAQLAADGSEHAFAIVDEAERLLGGCALNRIDRVNRRANVGYWVRTAATGRGVAREAVRQLVDFAFRSTDLVRLEIVCAVGNERSQRVAARAGALREGVLRRRLVLHGASVDAVLYSFVRGRDAAREQDGGTMTTTKQVVESARVPRIGPYSQAVRVGDLLYTAGQAGIDPQTGAVAGPTFEAQARQAFENLRAVLEDAGSGMAQVVRVTCYLTDPGAFAALNDLFGEYFPAAPPVRSAPVVSLPKSLLFSIDAIAVAGSGAGA